MKRVLSLMLACLLVLSVFTVCPVFATNEETTPEATTPELITEPETTEPEETEPEETEPEQTEPEETEPEETEPEETAPEMTEAPSSGMRTSDDLIALLKFEEGFCRYPVWDYSQYTVGYGTRCPDNMISYYSAYGITDAEAELLLRNTLASTEKLINTRLIQRYSLDMTQGQFDALVAFSYNMGPGWITSPSQNIHQQVAAGATGNTIIDALSRWCKAGGSVKSFLIRRRLSESYMYLEGKYAHTPPDNYGYVLYNGNGGSVSQAVQGYNSDFRGAPTATASHGSYTFAGWYTSPTGGVKVDVLGKEHNATTLYAHWEGVTYQEPELFDEPIVVKVTTNNLNLRKGPGTVYAIVGTANKGDSYEIWQVEKSGGNNWGYYKSGWLCLEYTNYANVIAGGEDTPTEPEPTEPTSTEPPKTEPAPTEPENTEKITVIVTANPYLWVRKGPGTGYITVDTLNKGERVEVTEQRTVGSMVWGKISNGWISMNYVSIQEEFESEQDQPAVSGQTGTVTCSSLNIRYGAGVNYSIVGSYRKGDTVIITEQKTVGTTIWGKTNKGWISMNNVALKDDSGSTGNTTGGTGNQETAVQKQNGTVSSADVLRIRSGAGTSYGVVGYLYPNTKVEILETKTVGATTWGKVTKGWVSMDYITLEGDNSGSGNTTGGTGNQETTTPQKQTGTVISNDVLRIRSGAGTNYGVVDFLYPNDKIEILETKTVGTTTWGRISKGWISMVYVKLDKNVPSDDLPDDMWDEDEEENSSVVRTVNVSCLLVRSGAGTQNTTVGYLYRGAKVTVTETTKVGSQTWGKIANGWICLDYTI